MGRTSDAKERLLQAATELVWQQSYGAVSVEALCEKAGVKKGTFYHFFPSKAELVASALEWHQQQGRQDMDRLFSACVPPLERLRHYFQHVYESQRQIHEQSGQVLGCPLFSVGCEISKQDPVLCERVQKLISQYTKYFESAVRDAQAEGSVRVEDVPRKARSLLAYMQGVLAQARILNDPELIRPLGEQALRLLGAETAVS